MFRMHRIFCATPWDLEEERLLFHDIVGRVNETKGNSKGVLMVPITLSAASDKRPLAYILKQNILECTWFIALVEEDWGPKERNFQKEYEFALECKSNPALPMQEVITLSHRGLLHRDDADPPPAADLPVPEAVFADTAAFGQQLETILNRWMDSQPANI